MRILHTESSCGWGGQEIRIFKEALGMRGRGHEIFFAVQEGSQLARKAGANGFVVVEIARLTPFSLTALFKMVVTMLKYRIDLVNTHSSRDSWCAGIAAKLLGKRVLRTRHLSSAIKRGINSFVVYRLLADRVVTTCQQTCEMIQAKTNAKPCISIPTGVDPKELVVSVEEVEQFRTRFGIGKQDCVAGTLCVLRGWKGVSDLLLAAKELDHPRLKWVVVGSGPSENYFKTQARELNVQDKVIFTGHIDEPAVALAAFDIFLLLSWAHEGVSQAALQAAWLKKPLVTTATGGLQEICHDQRTGLIVPPQDGRSVAHAVEELFKTPHKRCEMGKEAHALVQARFTFENMLNEMEKVYGRGAQKL